MLLLRLLWRSLKSQVIVTVAVDTVERSLLLLLWTSLKSHHLVTVAVDTVEISSLLAFSVLVLRRPVQSTASLLFIASLVLALV